MKTDQILARTTFDIRRGLGIIPENRRGETAYADTIVQKRLTSAARIALGDGVVVEATQGHESASKRTNELLVRGCAHIFAACICHHGLTVWVDALRKLDKGWSIVCIRKSASVKRQHLADLALQTWVAIESGIDIRSVEVMHPHRHADTESPQDIFQRYNASRDIFPLLPSLSQHIETIKQEGTPHQLPETAPHGPPRGPYSVQQLYKVRRDTLARLARMGVDQIGDIPEDFSLSKIGRRQRDAVIAGRAIVDVQLGEILRALPTPLTFIDFEAVSPALPLWPGTKPFESIPVQVSIHILGEGNVLEHRAWLAKYGDDPRFDLASFVCQNIPDQGAVIAYGATFEKTCIRSLASYLSAESEAKLLRVIERFFDMLPALRNHVYHPDFRGRFGLKSVAAAMLPDLAYTDLPIRSGGAAGLELEALLSGAMELLEDETRQALLAYCHHDTLVLAHLFEQLVHLTANPNE